MISKGYPIVFNSIYCPGFLDTDFVETAALREELLQQQEETDLFTPWLCISADWFMARIQPFMSSCVSALK